MNKSIVRIAKKTIYLLGIVIAASSYIFSSETENPKTLPYFFSPAEQRKSSKNIAAVAEAKLLTPGVSNAEIDEEFVESSDTTKSPDTTGRTTRLDIPRHHSVRSSVAVETDNSSPALLSRTSTSVKNWSNKASNGSAIGSPTAKTTSMSTPVIVLSDDQLDFINQEITKKLRIHYRMQNNESLTVEQKHKIDFMVKTFKPSESIFRMNPNFLNTTFADLEKIEMELKKYDGERRFWLGSIVTKDENKELVDSRSKKKREDFLEGRASFVQELLK